MSLFLDPRAGITSKRAQRSLAARSKQRRRQSSLEALEGRCLLAVTSTTPVPFTVNEGFAFTGAVMNFTANDAGPFTATIVWGDLTTTAGVVTPIAGGFAVSGTHTYAEDGPKTVTVTINDLADGTTTANNTTATVNESVLTSTSTPFTYPENTAPTVVTGTFTDPGSPDPATSFSASINWGDGTTTPGTVSGAAGTYSVSGSHLYGDEGVHNVVTTFSEIIDPTFTITTTSVATITEADVLTNGAIVAPAGAAIEGNPYSGPVATFSDTGFPTNLATDFNAVINWGDGTTTPGTVVAGPGVGNFTVNGTHTFLEEGTSPITVVVTDNAPGTAAITITGPIIIADAALTAFPVAVNGTQGAPLTNVDVATFTDANPFGTVSDFVATINWGDGTPVTAGVIIQDAAGTFHVQGSHTYTEESSVVYPITVTIVDNGGGRTVTDPSNSRATANSTATIVQSPLLPVANAVVATEGAVIAVGTPLASFTDTGGADAVGDYTATVNWGDGSGTTAATVSLLGNGGNFVVTSTTLHTYAEEGIYAVTVTITDNDPTNPNGIPTSAMTTSTATVADAKLSPGAAVALTPATGVKLTNVVVANFTDANLAAPTTDFTAVIDWGDGSPTSLGTIGGGAGAYTVSGSHQYASPGSYATKVVVTDDGGSVVTLTGTAVVTDLAVIGAVSRFPAVEGQNTGTIVLATFTDPNPLATVASVTATLPIGGWGDGTPLAPVTLAVQQIGGGPGGAIFQVLGSHTYAEEGVFPVNITVTTSGGVVTNLTPGAATVVDAALASQGATVQGVEGNAITNQLIATFTDANPAATVADFNTAPGSITVNWGDGTTETLPASTNITVTASGSPNGVVFSVNGTHTYAEEGSYKVTVTIVDAGGATTIAHSEADIADALLSATAGQPTVTTTESPIFPVPVFGAPIFTGAVGTFTDANPAPHPTAPVTDYTATIDWGDGTPQSAGTITQAAVGIPFFIVTGSHTYADSGANGGAKTYPLTIYVVDEGGAKVTLHNTATVNDNLIVLTGKLNPISDSGVSNSDAVTNVNQPNFYGKSEPFSHVTLSANGSPIGQVQAGSDGSWSITSGVALPDGTYAITATAVDQFGKTTTVAPTVITPKLVIDTTGPRITGTTFNRLNGEVDFTINDGLSGVYNNTILDSANYQLTKIHGGRFGKFLVTNITITPGAVPGSERVAIQFNGGRPIRGGFYLFTIRDSTRGPSTVQDIAGNSLDGEFYGSYPSGNGIRGGDFVAEIDAIHNKVFAPQTVVGTVSPPAPKGFGRGGAPVGAVHSGLFTIVNPQGSGPVFTAAKVRSKAVPHGPRRHK